MFFSYVSELDYIFLRNYSLKKTDSKIRLSFSPLTNFVPLCFALTNYGDVAEALSLQHKKTSGSLSVLVAIGGQNGVVYLLKVERGDKFKYIVCTKPGINYGQITSVSFGEKGLSLIQGSESGEIINYDLKEAYKARCE